MPLAQGKQLLQLLSTLKESNAHPTLNGVFEQMPYELSTSIDIVENRRLGALGANEPLIALLLANSEAAIERRGLNFEEFISGV